jgi:hypothetical protein
MHVNVHEFTCILTCIYYFKLFDLFRISTNLYEYVLKLFENMLTSGLPHAAALLDSRTLPCALPDSRILPRTLPHTLLHYRTQKCTLPQTEAHCMNLNVAHHTPHTTRCTRPHSAINMN